MLFAIITVVIVSAIVTRKMWSHHAWQQRLAAAWVRLQTSFLPATHVTLDQSQIGHIIPVNDDLLLIRHISGRLAFLPVRRPAPSGLSVTPFVKMLALVFFSV